MLQIETENIVRIIKLHFPNVEAIYLFGSQATGHKTKNSDIDVAFFSKHRDNITPLKVYGAQKELEVSLHKDVDLVHLNQASTVFQFQVVNAGVIIYVKNPSFLLQQEALVLSMYQRLNEERKHIMNEVASSGKIYS